MVESLTQEHVRHWLQSVMSTSAKCWVENPETVKESGFMKSKSFITYRVLLKASDGELIACRHRFSDFETLRDNLRVKYFSFGLLVPSLPPKRITNTQDKEFLTERMQGLTLLCEEIISFPWFRKDSVWQQFMGSAQASSPTASSTGSPEDILTFMCSQLPLPTLPLERMLSVKEEIATWEKKLKGVLEQLKSMQSALKQLNTASAQLQSSIESLASSDDGEFKFLNGKAEEMSQGNWFLKLDECEQVPTITEALNQFSMKKLASTANAAEYTNILFQAFIEREIARCSSIRELLRYQDDLSSSIESLRVTIEKLETKKSPNVKTSWQIKDAKSDLEEKIFLMNTFYKGFFFITIPLLVQSRSRNLRRMSESVGAFELMTATEQQQSAARLLSTLQLSAVQAVADTRSALDLLALCPLREVDDEEDILKGLGILPGLAHASKATWLTGLYERYSADGSVGVSSEAAAILATNKPASIEPKAPLTKSMSDLSLDEAATVDSLLNSPDEQSEEVPSKPPKPVVSDNLDLLVSTKSEEEEKAAQKERNALLFGD